MHTSLVSRFHTSPLDKGGGERSERGISRKPLQTLLIPRSPFFKGANEMDLCA